MVDPAALKAHLEDHAEVFERPTNRFVCPITLRECEPSELIEGHILNKALRKASRRQVIQYKKVDSFYGTRVEGTLVRFLNLRDQSALDLLRGNQNLTVEFKDGTTASAFVTSGKTAKAAKKKFPTAEVRAEGTVVQVYLRVGMDDPRLDGTAMKLVGEEKFFPSHWVAGLLKAALLTLFDMIGYRAIRNPLGGTLRISLANYFRDNGSRADAAKYFGDFQKSVKLLGKGQSPSDLQTNYQPFDFDSLEDRVVLLHCVGPWKRRQMFATTCIFKVNGATITITIPQALEGSDVATAWRRYQALMAKDQSLDQELYRAKYTDGRWEVEKAPFNVLYVGGDELSPAD